MKSRIRSLVTLFTILGVLFSQFAVAAYACPGVQRMAMASIESPERPPCHESPGPDSIDALCQAHCQQGDQSVERVAAPLPAPAIPVSFAIVRVEAPPLAEPPPKPQLSLLERPTEPPAAVRHCRFLI